MFTFCRILKKTCNYSKEMYKKGRYMWKVFAVVANLILLLLRRSCCRRCKRKQHCWPATPNIACVASVSVRFRRKEQGTRVKDRKKSGASKRAFHFSRGQNRKSPSSVFLCSEIKQKRLLRRLLRTLLDVTCCGHLYTLLHAVVCCWESLCKV